MDNIATFFNEVYGALSRLSFGRLVVIALGTFGGLMAAFALLCALCVRLRSADKRPVLHFVNCFAALFFAIMLTGQPTGQALFFSALFWLAGYLYYGAMCAFFRPQKSSRARTDVVSALDPPPARKREDVAPARESGVRLGHALAIADRLLIRGLSRADRQELERIKTALTVIQVKGDPTPQESEVINAHFNALLKLMAKYDY